MSDFFQSIVASGPPITARDALVRLVGGVENVQIQDAELDDD